jgi:hypothetical protein
MNKRFTYLYIVLSSVYTGKDTGLNMTMLLQGNAEEFSLPAYIHGKQAVTARL